MNIKEHSPNDFSGLTNLTNNSLSGLPDSTSNQTKILLTALGSFGDHTWDMNSYWIALAPFLLSVPLFIVAGGIFRFAIQSAVKYRVYWHIALLLLALAAYPAIYWTLPMAPGGDLAYMVLHFTRFVGFSVWKLYVALRAGKERHIWITFFFVAIGALLLDQFVNPFAVSVVMWVSWLFLGWRWYESTRSSKTASLRYVRKR